MPNDLSHKGQRITIQHLAEDLGLTKGTVSRALNDYPDISERTRLRVRRAADRLGYRPLAHAQAIRTGRVRAIGLVLQIDEHDGHRPFVADFLAGISQAASDEGWSLTVSTAQNDAHMLELLKNLIHDRKVDGFIVPRTRLHDPRIDLLQTMDVPFVMFGRTSDPADCAWYDIASDAAMRDAVERLAKLGHRHIGFIPGPEKFTFSKLRRDGFAQGVREMGVGATIGTSAVTREQGEQASVDLLRAHPDVTAIVCAVDQAAIGVYDAAARRGLHVGKDLSVIAYDGIPEGGFITPPLATYQVDSRRAGGRLANMLIERARGAPADGLQELEKAQFLNRQSCAPAPITISER